MGLPQHAAASLLAFALVWSSADAQTDAISRRTEEARASLNAGAERSAIYALSDPRLPVEARVEAGGLSLARGFDPVSGGYVVYKGVSWSPVLAYDSDINGGSGKDGFSFAGFDFVIPERQRRKEGIVVGGQADAFLRYALGSQTVLDLSADTFLAWSPEHEIGKLNIGVSACATRQLERNLYASGCALLGYFENDLSRDMTKGARASVHRILDWGGYIHDVALSVSETHITDRIEDQGYSQGRLEISNHAISATGHQFGYTAMLGEPVDGQKVRTRALSVYTTGKAFTKPFTYGGGFSSYEGAQWLGAPIDEEEYSLFLQVPLHSKIMAQTEYTKTISGSQITNGDQVSFTIHVQL